MSFITEFLFDVVFGAFFCWTGEIILFVCTFGRRTPRWDLYTRESPTRFVVFSELSTWIGLAFWITVAAILAIVLI